MGQPCVADLRSSQPEHFQRRQSLKMCEPRVADLRVVEGQPFQRRQSCEMRQLRVSDLRAAQLNHTDGLKIIRSKPVAKPCRREGSFVALLRVLHIPP